MWRTAVAEVLDRTVSLPVAGGELAGDLVLPEKAHGLVVFAHGSGSSRHSRRNRWVAEQLRHAGLGTLLIDLLTDSEDQVDARTRELRFDIRLLSGRVSAVLDHVSEQPGGDLPTGLFGASTGAAAALGAAAQRSEVVRAVVSRGGRPELASDLASVRAPTLLIVGGQDREVLAMNQQAERQLTAPCEIRVVPAATHLFEEPGALEQVADAAADWFRRHLG